MNKFVININEQGFVWIYVFSPLGYIPRSMVAVSYGKSVFSFVRS